MKHGYRECTRATFQGYLLDAQRILGDRGQMVSMPEDQEEREYWYNPIAHSGFSLCYGEFSGAFSKWGQQLRNMVDTASAICRRHGLVQMTLNCFEPLVPIYERHGFRVDWWDGWKEHEAPEGWPAKFGNPRVAYMSKGVY